MTSNPLTGYPSIDKPWLKYYNEEAINAPLPECSIFEYMYENNKDYPNDIAINYLGREISYRELFVNIDKTASAFLSLGVKPGEIVTIALPSIPEALYCVYALNKIGAVSNMIHPLAGEKEILFYLNEVESRVAVIFDKTYELIAKSIRQTTIQHAIVVSAGCSLPLNLRLSFYLKNKKVSLSTSGPFCFWDDFIRKGKNIVSTATKKDSNKLALISHTGGTTGEPKGVMFSDRNINALIWQMEKIFPVMRQESAMAVLPPFINYSLVNSMLEPLALGLSSILIPKYEPNQIIAYLQKYKPEWVLSIPPYWEELLHVDSKGIDLSFLKCPFYGGESMDPQIEEELDEFLYSHNAPCELKKGWGMTECVSVGAVTPYGFVNLDSVGLPIPRLNCKIIDISTKKELLAKQEGEICFSGNTIMLGYYKNPLETDKILLTHDDGCTWLHTGDLGYIDENGFVKITGRIKRILITRGKDQVSTKMFPERIEKVIMLHPSVRACSVIGVSDIERINYPEAFIELNDNFSPNEQLIFEIKQLCEDKLPDYQIPEKIEFCEALPRTSRGKVDYRALEKLAEEAHQ